MSELTSRASKTVLVCDDDRLVLLGVTSALRQAGYQVVEADNGDDAILLARQYRPNLAILDIRMDGKSGLDVAAYLRDYVGQPFIFLSAYSGQDEIARGMSFGALAYLAKPVETSRLLGEVERALNTIEGEDPEPEAPAEPDERSSVQKWVAAGVLMERHKIDLPSALRRLAETAQSDSLTLHEASLQVLGGAQTV